MGILDLFFLKSCLGCNRSGRYICEDCLRKVRIPLAVCPECLRVSINGMTHPKCLRQEGLNGHVSLWNYEGVVRRAILTLKYKHAKDIAKELSEYITRKLPRGIFKLKDPILVPIPLFWLRENWRGFNQSELVGKMVAESFGWRFEPKLLVRSKMKVPQTDLKREERLLNVRGIFSLNPKFSSSLTQNSYILFDDVWTTGSTLKEAASVLKRNGARKVFSLTLARGVS